MRLYRTGSGVSVKLLKFRLLKMNLVNSETIIFVRDETRRHSNQRLPLQRLLMKKQSQASALSTACDQKVQCGLKPPFLSNLIVLCSLQMALLVLKWPWETAGWLPVGLESRYFSKIIQIKKVSRDRNWKLKWKWSGQNKKEWQHGERRGERSVSDGTDGLC